MPELQYILRLKAGGRIELSRFNGLLSAQLCISQGGQAIAVTVQPEEMAELEQGLRLVREQEG